MREIITREGISQEKLLTQLGYDAIDAALQSEDPLMRILAQRIVDGKADGVDREILSEKILSSGLTVNP